MRGPTIVQESGNTAEENAALLRRHLQSVEMHKWVSGLAPWELAFTGTWRWEASAASAQRGFERWMRREAPDVSYFYALERNPSREGFHVHSLWSNTAGIYRRLMWERWFGRFGRNKLEPIKDRIAAEEYLTKYVTKEVTWEERGWWNVHLVEPMIPKLAEVPKPQRVRKQRAKYSNCFTAGEKFCSKLEEELTREAAL